MTPAAIEEHRARFLVGAAKSRADDKAFKLLYEMLFVLWNGDLSRRGLEPLTRVQFSDVMREIWDTL